jgi:hypothetical protein
MQGRQRSCSQRKLRNNLADRTKLANGAVDKRAGRPAAENIREQRAVGTRHLQRRAVRRQNL